MAVRKFLNHRKTGLFRLCLNFASILLAAMFASKFFAEFPLTARILMGLMLLVMILGSIIFGVDNNK